MQTKNIFHLILFLSFGLFSCQSNDASQTAQQSELPAMSAAQKAIDALFPEETFVIKMHLFSVLDPSGDYPYQGKAVAESAFTHFSDDLKEKAKSGLFACYKIQEGYYIMRAAGKYAPTDLILCQFNENTEKLEQTQLLSYLWCDEGVCNQQDAWLTDLDTDNDLEMLIRERHINEAGATEEDQLTGYWKNAAGQFEEGSIETLRKESFVFEKVMQ